jgi:hypothetical protein
MVHCGIARRREKATSTGDIDAPILPKVSVPPVILYCRLFPTDEIIRFPA